MTIVPKGSLVLVSGANGFIAIHVVQTLLDRGYAVRGTVRDERKAGYLRKTFSAFSDKLEIVVVEDITKEDAFDNAVKGVDAILHTASPFHLKASKLSELADPAVNGTTSILKSAKKFGENVKRVVITGSTASVLEEGGKRDATGKFIEYDENDWNEQAIMATGTPEKDATASGSDRYRASKALAERAAGDFVLENKKSLQWDLAVLNPPFVFGPVIHDVGSLDQLNTSSKSFYDYVIHDKEFKDKEEEEKYVNGLSKHGSSWIDVRDLALAHVLALEKDLKLSETEAYQRLIVTSGKYTWQDWITAAQKVNDAKQIYKSLPKGSLNPPEGEYTYQYSANRAKEILGLGTQEYPYKTIEETVKDVLVDFKQRGW